MVRTTPGQSVTSDIWLWVTAGVVLRLLFVPLPGYDVEVFRVWSDALARAGLSHAYELDLKIPINYPPVSLYILWGLGRLYRYLAATDISGALIPAYPIKLAIIAADAAAIAALTIFLWARRGDQRPSLRWIGAYALHPAVMWNTAYWAGIDAFASLFVILALTFLVPGRFGLALTFATVGGLVKPLVAPLWLLVAYIMIRVNEPSHTPRALAISAGAIALVYLPWLLQGNLVGAVSALGHNLGNYAVMSANAHNIWWVVSGGDGWRPDTDGLPFLSYRVVGLLALALAAVWTLRLLPRRPNANQILHSAAYLLAALPMLMTEVHENWLLTAFPPLVAACAMDRRVRPLFYVFSGTLLLNLGLHDPHFASVLGSLWTDNVLAPFRLGNALLATGTFAFWTSQLPRYMTDDPEVSTSPRMNAGGTDADDEARSVDTLHTQAAD